MRRLVLTLGLAAILGSSFPAAVASAAVQASVVAVPSRLALGFDGSATAVQDYKNNKVDAAILEIARATRSEDGVYVRIQTTKPGMKCSIKVKFFDGTVAQPPRSNSGADGICILHFDVPSRGSVVGPALLKVQVLNKRNDVRAKLVQDFAVFDRYKTW